MEGSGRVIAGGNVQNGGAYEATTPLTAKFRHDIRAASELTSDDQLHAVAELAEAPVSLEGCRQLDPQTRIAMFCRLDVSPAEIPRWRRIPPGGMPAIPRSEIDGLLRAGRGARIEEHALLDGHPYWRYVGPAGDVPRHLRRDQGHASG